MSISRRKFIRAGSVAALAAAVPVKLFANGQGRKERDGNPAEPPIVLASDPLSYYTKSAFSSYLHSTFLVRAGALGTIESTLTQVRDTSSGNVSPAGEECFSLLFQNQSGPSLPQGTYGVEHAALGSFALFLVPGGSGNDGKSYVAIVNRLANSPALFSVPAKSTRPRR